MNPASISGNAKGVQSITISGGKVTATNTGGNSNSGTAIGGGGRYSTTNLGAANSGGKITITGGDVTARITSANNPSPAIGHYHLCPAGLEGTVSVTGGDVKLCEETPVDQRTTPGFMDKYTLLEDIIVDIALPTPVLTPTPTPAPSLSPTPTGNPATVLPTVMVTATVTATITATVTAPPTPTTDKFKPGDANCDTLVNIDDILLIRDVIFGEKTLTPQGYLNLRLKQGDRVSIDHILLVRDVIFGGA